MTRIRTGQAGEPLSRDEFRRRFADRFQDPAFEPEQAAIARLETIAWQALQDNRKAPFTQPAGEGFADPSYELCAPPATA